MELLAAYSLDEELGRGSFSGAHLATCNKTGVAVAVNIISSTAVKHGRPTVEVDVLKKCQHPNIIALRDELVTRKNDTALIFSSLRHGSPQAARAAARNSRRVPE